jgi:hypothetical protein
MSTQLNEKHKASTSLSWVDKVKMVLPGTSLAEMKLSTAELMVELGVNNSQGVNRIVKVIFLLLIV